MNLTITDHLPVGENILVITVTNIRASKNGIDYSQLSLSLSGTIVSA